MKRPRSIRKNKGFITPDNKVASIAKFVNDFDNINKAAPIYCSTAVGSISKSSFTDKLVIPPKTYKLYESLSLAQKALETGELKIDEPYCCSYYEYDKIFPELDNQKSMEEAILYLKELNNKGLVCFCWTFLDDEEIKEISEKIPQKRYY